LKIYENKKDDTTFKYAVKLNNVIIVLESALDSNLNDDFVAHISDMAYSVKVLEPDNNFDREILEESDEHGMVKLITINTVIYYF
jgi:hypothetical protein